MRQRVPMHRIRFRLHPRHLMPSPILSLQIVVGRKIAAKKKKKPVDVEATVIHGGNGNTNTRNRLTNLNSGNQNNTTNSSNNDTGKIQQSREVQEMNDIQVRVIKDNVDISGINISISGNITSGGNNGGTSGGSRNNWRHNEATIEVAMASPEEENLPPEIDPPSYLPPSSTVAGVPPVGVPPQVTTALVNETSMTTINNSNSAANAEALCDQNSGKNGKNLSDQNAGEDLPQVKISNL